MAKRYYDGDYAGQDARRAQEEADFGMISGKGEFANMPQNVVFKAYPKPAEYMPENINDGLSGVDSQIKMDVGKRNAKFAPKKV